MSLASVYAKNIKKSTSKTGVTNRYNNAVTFTEQNIQFHVFLNGDFDFNTPYRNTKYYNTNNEIVIERNRRDRIKRVGNTFINYNNNGSVNRIGTVFINYNYGKLVKVGALNIRYDRWGNTKFYGNVKYNDHRGTNTHYNSNSNNMAVNINIGNVFNYNDAYFYKRNFKNSYRKYKEDTNYLYYRVAPNVKTGKYGKFLKRRKNKTYKKNNYYKKTTTTQKLKSRRNR
ncbi:conserved protein of unknown function [Tenacibaculum aestuariivivum]